MVDYIRGDEYACSGNGDDDIEFLAQNVVTVDEHRLVGAGGAERLPEKLISSCTIDIISNVISEAIAITVGG